MSVNRHSVAVVHSSTAYPAVRRVIEALNPFAELPPAAHVVLKPNLVVSRSAWLGANTRPEIVEALVALLRDHGIRRITIADGSGMGESATRAFQICGYHEIAAKYNLDLLDIERDRFVSVPTRVDGPFAQLSVSRTVAECDYLINVPVIKAHCQTRMTCSLKNLKGVLPSKLKSGFHGTDLERAIAQLAATVTPEFILADGTYGDLTSELGGSPVNLGVIAAGYDPLAIDCFAAATLGFAPSAIAHLAHYAQLRGVDLDRFRPQVRALNHPRGERRFRAEQNSFRLYPCSVHLGSACSTCHGNLLFALKRLKEARRLGRRDRYYLGRFSDRELDSSTAPSGFRERRGGHDARGRDTPGRGARGGRTVAVGDCAVRLFGAGAAEAAGSGRAASDSPRSCGPAVVAVSGCPPSAAEIVTAVTAAD